MPVIDPAALLAGLSGRVHLPGGEGWDEARRAWSLGVDQRPALVATVADAEDVVRVVRAARAAGLRVAPQGTGHGAGSLGDLAGTVLLRTGLLRELAVDPAAGTVRVGAGITWGEVGAALAPHGLAALAGSAHDVGVVGYTLGGGVGWLGRAHGLAASSVVAIEVVTADGVLRRATAERDPELFWALRGGGGHFGVVTAMELRVLPIDSVVAGMMLFPIERAAEVLGAYAEWSAAVPESVTTAVRLLRLPPLPELPDLLRGRAFAAVDGALLDDPETADALLAPLRALGPVVDTFAPMPPHRLVEIHMDPPAPSASVGDGVALTGLGPETIAAILAEAGPGAETPLLAVDIRHLGGALDRPHPGGGAVDRLDGEYGLFAVAVTPVPELVPPAAAAVERMRAAVAPWAAPTTYSNFREGIAEAEELHGPEALTRLRAVKAAVDPDGLFRGAHRLS